MNTQELVDKLKTHQVLVEFIKVDGSRRKMLCTQNTAMISAAKLPTTHSDATRGIITVYDLEKNDWRSMRADRIKKWTVES